MSRAIHTTVIVKEGGLLELRLPELRAGDSASVTVRVEEGSAKVPDWRQFAGVIDSGNPNSADNDGIDEDLADEAARGL